MTTQRLGTSQLAPGRLAYGCMRIAGDWCAPAAPDRAARAHRAIAAALDAGYTLFDHADIYADGACEALFGDFLAGNPSVRGRIVIASKAGIRFPGAAAAGSRYWCDASREHLLRACERSLRRLRTDHLDLYQLHRPDPLAHPAEVAAAFEELHRSGKVRAFGVSNFPPAALAALAAHCPVPLVVNQVEIHLGALHALDDGTLDQCLERTITPLAWSPLGGGFLARGGVVPPGHPRRAALQQLVMLMDEMATRYGVSRTVLALAWLLKHPARILPIVGSSDPAHIAEAATADAVALDREDWYRLLGTAGRPEAER